ncbi:Protein of unknown function [Bacillus cereus]|nr:Protein of unknown function [Bacillus cereus]
MFLGTAFISGVSLIM